MCKNKNKNKHAKHKNENEHGNLESDVLVGRVWHFQFGLLFCGRDTSKKQKGNQSKGCWEILDKIEGDGSPKTALTIPLILGIMAIRVSRLL